MKAAFIAAVLSLAPLACSAAPAEPPQDARSRFVAQCRSDILAESPESASWVDGHCTEAWTSVARSNPIVDALLSPFKAEAGPAMTAADLRSRAAMVRWGVSTEPTMAAMGEFVGLHAEIPRQAPLILTLGWSAIGESIPYNVLDALKLRGATVAMIGCYDYGISESNSVYRVTAPGHAPFALTLYRREAPTASAQSSLVLSVAADRRVPTMASLRASERDADWQTKCA